MFPCHRCQKQFSLSIALAKHRCRKRSPSVRFNDNVNVRQYDQSDDNRAESSRLGPRRIFCQYCRRYVRKEDIDRHENEHADNLDDCSPSEYEEAIANFSPVGLEQCTECNRNLTFSVN